MLEEKYLALEYLGIKRKKVSALDQEAYLVSLMSVSQSHLRITNLDSGCLIHTCSPTQGGKSFTGDPAASEVLK